MTESLLSPAGSKTQPQPWLQSCAFDVLYIAAPAFITSILALCFKDHLENMRTLPLWAWISFVLLVDVAHVYATLFRSYFDKKALAKNGALLLFVPLACWGVGTLLYSIDGLLFWRVLAYLAVFHFIRQQYGFMMLYSRKDPAMPLDSVCSMPLAFTCLRCIRSRSGIRICPEISAGLLMVTLSTLYLCFARTFFL